MLRTLINRPVQSVTRTVGYQFKSDEAVWRDFEKLRLANKRSDSFPSACDGFHGKYMPQSEEASFKNIKKFVKELESNKTDVTVGETFLADIEMLAKQYKTKSNVYQLFCKQQSGKLTVPKGKRFVSVVAEKFRNCPDREKTKLLSAAEREYEALYRRLSSKHGRENMTIPQFLNPYNNDQVVAQADRAIWSKVANQLKKDQSAATTAEKERKTKKQENSAIRDELRAKHGFNAKFVFPDTARKLLIRREMKANPGKLLKDILKELPKAEKKLTAAQKSKLEKESKTLEEAYNKQNAAAAVRAIAAKDWMALKKTEVIANGTPEDLTEFNRAKRESLQIGEPSDAKTSEGKQMKAITNEARVKYAFPKKPKTVYMLYLATSGKTPQDMQGKQKDAWKKELSKQTMATLEAKAQEAKKKYEMETRVAATKAIREQDWIALRVGEVKAYGSKEDMQAYNKAKRDM